MIDGLYVERPPQQREPLRAVVRAMILWPFVYSTRPAVIHLRWRLLLKKKPFIAFVVRHNVSPLNKQSIV